MGEQVNKSVPAIRFGNFKDDWQVSTFGDLFPITSAARVHKHEWTKNGVPFFRTSDVVSAYKNEDNIKAFISHELFLELSAKIGRIKKGDLLVTGGGSIGIPYLVSNDEPLYFKDADLLWFKASGAVNSYFLYTFFATFVFERYVKSISHIGTIAHYTVEQAKATPIAKPDKIEEQQKIGSFFKQLDTQLSLHQTKLDKLNTLKQAMLQKMFPQGNATEPEIRFKGFGGEWNQVELTEVCEIIGGGTPSTAVPSYWNGDIDWYSPTEIGKQVYANGSVKKITALGFENSSARMLPANRTILFTSRAGIGDMAILKHTGCTNQGFQSLVLNNETDPYFIYSMGYLIKNYAIRHASGSTFLEISSKQLSKMPLCIPSNEEQQKIGAYFRKLDELIALERTQLDKLKQIKQACLAGMFV